MENLVWVDIETTKATNRVVGYKGQIQKSVFEGIVSNQLTSGYIKLDKVYWTSAKYDDFGSPDGEELFQFGSKGNFIAYLGETFLKIEHLVSISPIDGEADLERFKKNAEKHLSVVSPIRP